MSIYHIAKILEICGFLLATVVGGILLNPEMAGRFAHKIEVKLAILTLKLGRQYESFLKPMAFMAKLDGFLGAIFLRGIAVACITVGLVKDVTWLFWLGVAIAIPYAVLGAIVTFARFRSRAKSYWMWVLYPLILCCALILAFAFAPIGIFIYWVLLLSHGIVTAVMSIIVLRDATKKYLVITGSTLVIIGLVLETIATW